MPDLYRKVFGFNKAVYLLAPMILPDNTCGRITSFQDCFLGRDGKSIIISCRLGRFFKYDHMNEMIHLRSRKELQKLEDDSVNPESTFFVYSIPEKWKKDFDLIVKGKLDQISKGYMNKIFSTFPSKLGDDKELIDYIFGPYVRHELYMPEDSERLDRVRKFLEDNINL